MDMLSAGFPPAGPDLRALSDIVTGLAVNPAATVLASVAPSGTTILWDTASQRPLGPPIEVGAGVFDAVFSADGSALYLATYDGRVEVLDITTGELGQPAATEELGRPILSLALSPSGDRLAIAGASGLAEVWDPLKRERISSLDGQKNDVWGIGFSPDGAQVAATDINGVTRIWRTADGALLSHGLGGGTSVWPDMHPLGFGPDGSFLVAFDNTSYRRWDLDPSHWQQVACRLAARPLRAAERNRYLAGDAARACTGSSSTDGAP